MTLTQDEVRRLAPKLAPLGVPVNIDYLRRYFELCLERQLGTRRLDNDDARALMHEYNRRV